MFAASSFQINTPVGGVALHASDADDADCHTPGACLTQSGCFSEVELTIALTHLSPLWHLLLDVFHIFPWRHQHLPVCGSLLHSVCPHVFRSFFLGFERFVCDGTNLLPVSFDAMWPSLLPVSLPVLVRLLLCGSPFTIFLECFSWRFQNPCLRSVFP